ncbi:MAG: hypothetical protein AAGB16_07190 [Pseudomonadota bacterium]
MTGELACLVANAEPWLFEESVVSFFQTVTVRTTGFVAPIEKLLEIERKPLRETHQVLQVVGDNRVDHQSADAVGINYRGLFCEQTTSELRSAHLSVGTESDQQS